MNKNNFLLLIVLLLASCSPNGNLEETITSEQALTAIAQTVGSELATVNPPTETFTPSPSLESSPTETPTPTFSQTVAATATQTFQSFDPPDSAACDDAAFVDDVTVPDGTAFSPGEVFTKTWRIQNIGSCEWASSYTTVFVDGSIMGASSPTSLGVEMVPSGSVVDISIGMVAPETPGRHTGYWRMQNESGLLFGVTFYVEIVVSGSGGTQSATPDGTAAPTETVVTPSPTRTKRFGPRVTPTP